MRSMTLRALAISTTALVAACGGSYQNGTTAATGGTGGTTSAVVGSLSLIQNSASLPSNATDPSSGLPGVTLTAIVVDNNNNAISGASVVFSASLPAGSTRTGSPVALIVGGNATTDSSGTAKATVYTGGNTSLGLMSVTATVGGIAKSLNITVISPTSAGGGGVVTAAKLTLTVSNPQLPSDVINPSDPNAVRITGILLDSNNVAVPGVQVTFSTGRGQITVVNATSDSNGQVKGILTTGGDQTAGAITVTVTAPQTGSTTPLSKSTTITEVAGVSGAAVADFSFLASSSTLPADASTQGSGVTLTVTALDSSHNVIANVNVKFTANKGALQVLNGTTDSSGQAKAVLTTGGDTAPGPITLTAIIGASSKQLTVQEVAAATPNVQIGTLNTTTTPATFTVGQIAVGAASIAAGGSAGLRVDIVDTNSNNAPFIGTNVTVTFSSACAASGLATINGSPLTTASGVANVTYVDKGCGGTGASGNTDTIFATASAGGSSLSAQGTIKVLPTSIGSMQFVSATPTIIGLKGSGQPENSIVVFKLLNSSGGPITGQTVNFSLSTTVGGITLGTAGGTTASGQTDASGFVQTQVNSGTVHTSVRVTATTSQGGTTFTSQSARLVISSGNPDQDSFSLSASCFNVEALHVDGATVPITIRAADHFNNPVPDGTAVAFTTEGGAIQDSCETVSGACSVNWISQDPRPAFYAAADNSARAGRSTVLATALGEESFIDLNGNGLFEDGEFNLVNDLSEAFRDDNESGTRTAAAPQEEFLDFNRNGTFDGPDGKYNGTLCAPGQTKCGAGIPTSLHVRKSLQIIMSGSAAILVSGAGGDVSANPAAAYNSATRTFTVAAGNPGATPVTKGGTIFASFVVRDENDEPMPRGTTIALSSSGNGGSVSAPSTFTVPCMTADDAASNTYVFGVTGADTPGSGVLTLTVTSPGGVQSIYQFSLVAN